MKNFKTYLKLLMTLVLFLNMTWLFASAPTWTRVDYTNTTTFTGEIVINDFIDPDLPVNAGDYIGAFVDGECRMIAEIFENAGTLYVSAVLHGGDLFGTSDPELVEFKLWDFETNTPYDVMGYTFSDPGNHIALFPVGEPMHESGLSSLEVNGSDILSGTTTDYTLTVSTVPDLTDYLATLIEPVRAEVNIDPATDLGSNNVTTITVTAEDGTQTIYTITFTPDVCTTPAPSASDVTACEGGTYTLTATPVASGTINWYADLAKSTLLLEGSSTYTPTATGTYYAATNDGCVGDATAVELTTIAPPTVSITSGTTVCKDADLAITADVSASTFTAEWTGDVSPLASVTSENTTFNASTVADYDLTLTVTDGNNCVGTDAVTITVNVLPTVAVSAVTTPVCQNGAPVQLAATVTPAGGSGAWSGDGVNPNTGEFSPTTSGDVTVTYTYTDGNGCVNSDDEIVAVSSAPSYTITGGGNFCPGGTSPNVEIALAGTAPWSFTINDGTTSTPVTATTSPYVITEAAEGTYTLTTISDDGGCPGAVTTESVTVAQTSQPSAPAAPDVVACSGDDAILTATGLDIKWYDNETLTGTPESGSSYNTGITTPGTYNFWVTQTDGCESPARQVVLTVNAIPDAPTGGSVEQVCEGETIPALSFNETGLVWYADAAKTNELAQADTYTPTSPSAGTNFYYAAVKTGECESAIGTAVLTVNATPATPVITAVDDVCQANDFITLDAQYTWYADAALTTPIGTAYSISEAKDVTLYATKTTSGCESDAATVSFTINATPAAPAAATFTYLPTDATQTMTVAGTNITWYDEAYNQVATGTSYSDPQTVEDSYTYYVTDEVNGCISDYAKVTLTISLCATPAISVADESICEGDATVTFTASGTNVKWYDSETATVEIATGTTFTPSVTAVGTYTYYVTQTTTCESSKTSFEYAINDVPDAPAVTSETVTVGSANPPLVATGTAIAWYSDMALTTQISSGTSYTSPESAVGSYNYYATQTVGGCESPSATATLTISPSTCNLSAPVIGSSTYELCQGETTTIQATIEAGSSIVWYSGTALVGMTNPFTIGLAGSYTVKQMNGTCESPLTTFTVSVTATPSAPSVDDVTVCDGASEALMAETTSVWYSDAALTQQVATGSSYTPTTAGTYYVTNKVGECESAATSAMYTIGTTPTLSVQSETAPAGSAIPALTVTSNGTVTWYADQAMSSVVNTGLSYNTGKTAIGTYTYYVQAANGTCVSDLMPVTLTITDPSCTILAPVASVSDDAICEGDATPTLTANGAFTIKWYSDAALTTVVATSASFTPSVSAAGTYTYYVNQEGSCVSPAASVSFVINALPTVSVTPANLVVSSTDPAVAITVSPAGGTLSGTGVSGNTFDPSGLAGNYDITYSYTDGNGCSNTDVSSITVNSPGPDLTDLNALIKAVEDTLAYASDNNLIGNDPGNYTFADYKALEDELDNAINTRDNATTEAEVTAAITALQFDLDNFDIVPNTEIYPTDVEITKAAIALEVGDIETLEYTYKPSTYTVETPLTWISADENIAIVNDGVVTAVGAGVTNVIVTFEGESAQLDMIIISVKEKETAVSEVATSNIKVYPTKAESTVYVKSDEVITGVTMFSITGELVKSYDSDSKLVIIDITDVAAGTYTLQIETESGLYSEKIVK